MIGHRLNGHTIILAAPEGKNSWAILAVRDTFDHYPYVVSDVRNDQLPTPDHWGQGTYHHDPLEAVADYLGRIVTNPEWLAPAIETIRDNLRSTPPEPPYTIEGCEHCAGCGEAAWDCICETTTPEEVEARPPYDPVSEREN